MYRHARKRCCRPLFFMLTLLSQSGLAAECGILRVQTHRTLGATISHNTCSVADNLALGSIIELQANTRVWLESCQNKQTDIAHVVCLNKSSSTQKLKIAHTDFPWLAPLNTSGCGTWTINRLECKPTNNPNALLVCAAIQKESVTTPKTITAKTSVTLRGLGKRLANQPPYAQNNWVDFLSPGINVCRKLLNTNQTITLTWTLKMSGEVSRASIVGSGIDNAFAACSLEALEHAHFPAVSHEIRLTASF